MSIVCTMAVEQLILASASPRRRRILADAGFIFTVLPVECTEYKELAGVSPVDIPVINAILKARKAALDFPGHYVLGADTVIVADGTVLGKPADKADAERMLSRLSGRKHQVITGVAIVLPGGGLESFSDITEVCFKSFDISVIREYMAKVDVSDKAGAYAIQEHGDMLVEYINGSFANVEGLPIEHLCKVLPLLNR